MHLTDEVMRISSSKASGKILRNINQKVTYKGLGLIDFFGLKVLILMSNIFPGFAKYIVETRVKLDSKGIILNSKKDKLKTYIDKRKQQDIDVNINTDRMNDIRHETIQTKIEVCAPAAFPACANTKSKT